MGLIAIPVSPNKPSVVTPDADNCQVCKGYAGQFLPAGSPCYINSTGTILLNSATVGFTQPVVGWTINDYNTGEMVTLYQDVKITYPTTTTLTPGTFLYMSTNTGQLDDTQINGCPPVARVLFDNSTSFSTNRRNLLWVFASL